MARPGIRWKRKEVLGGRCGGMAWHDMVARVAAWI